MTVKCLILTVEKLGDGWVVFTEIKDWLEPINNNDKAVYFK